MMLPQAYNTLYNPSAANVGDYVYAPGISRGLRIESKTEYKRGWHFVLSKRDFGYGCEIWVRRNGEIIRAKWITYVGLFNKRLAIRETERALNIAETDRALFGNGGMAFGL